jgi:hypothetical protein
MEEPQPCSSSSSSSARKSFLKSSSPIPLGPPASPPSHCNLHALLQARPSLRTTKALLFRVKRMWSSWWVWASCYSSSSWSQSFMPLPCRRRGLRKGGKGARPEDMLVSHKWRIGNIRGACNGGCVDAVDPVLVPHPFLPPSPPPSTTPPPPTHLPITQSMSLPFARQKRDNQNFI